MTMRPLHHLILLAAFGAVSAVLCRADDVKPAATRPSTRKASDLHETLTAIMKEAFQKDAVASRKDVVLLGDFGSTRESPQIRTLLMGALLEGLGDQVTMRPAPPSVRLAASDITPAAVAKARWPDQTTPPLVLVAKCQSVRKGQRLNLTLLDDKAVHWEGSLVLSRDELKGLPAVSSLNESIVVFAATRMGTQVGNGECWTLANEALAACRATRGRQIEAVLGA